MSKMQNPFIWHDLMTPDREAAKTFYAAVVGWSFSEQMPSYSVAETGGTGVGGIMDTPPEMKGMPPFWSGYVYTPDVDAKCKEVIKLGGKIMREAWTIPDVGRMAVIGDTTGAGLMIMQPLSTAERKEPVPGSVATVGWNELHADDLGMAWDFYSALFGWTKGTAMDMGPAGLYQLFQIDGKDVGGMMKKQAEMPRATWAYYFTVDGIDAGAARIAKNGGKVVMGPHDVPGGMWIVSAFDPQGGFFALLSATK